MTIMGRSAKKKIFQGIIALLSIAVMMVSQTVPTKAALTPDDVQSILNNWPSWVAGDNLGCSFSAEGAVSTPAGANSGSWNSGLQPPYILEQFMIEVLKDIAQKRNVSQEDILTEEHVIALVAFAIGEGGDINNRFLFNPLNTGLNAPDLLAPGWEHNQSGLQAFKSFDAGVEANARVMTMPNQKRLSDILIERDSTAQEFMRALTYFNEYPGNKLWAEASLPPHADEYYQQRLLLVGQVRKNYDKLAGLVIGTDKFEFKENMILPSKLQFHPEGSGPFSVDSGSEDCSGSGSVIGSGDLMQTVVKYAWPEYHKAPYFIMKPEYQTAVQAAQKRGDYVGGGIHPGIDCGGFVTLVMHDSGVDPDYNKYKSNVVAQRRWMNDHPERYEKKTDITNPSQLQPGDIFINSDASHTYMFVGSIPNFKGNAASASFSTTGASWRTPMASPAYGFSDATWYRLKR